MRFAAALVALLISAYPARADGYPLRGLTPWENVGGLVTIPGAPLPAVPRESVRTAILVYQPILAMARLLGDETAVARGCGYLASLHASVGEMEKAMQLFDEAQVILERSGAKGHEAGWVYNNRGLAELHDGHHAEALRSFRNALETLEPNRAADREPRATALANVASAYWLLGDAEHAEEAYLDALDLLRRLKKEGTRVHQAISGNLATLYATIGDHTEARRILETLADQRGLSQRLRFKVLNDLGYTLSMLRDFAAAETRLREAEMISAEGSSERTLVLMNRGAMYSLAGNLARSEETTTRALRLIERLHGEESRLAAAAKANLGAVALSRGELPKADRLLVEATQILSKGTGDEEVFVFATRALALVAQKRGQHARAAALSRDALDLAKVHLDRILAFGSEAQRLAYLGQASPYDQLANLGDASLLAEAVLASKAAVLESLLVERALARRSVTPQDREQLDRIHALRLQIMETIGRGESGDLESLKRGLKAEETALAKRLAPQLTRPRSQPRLEDVQALLAHDQVLVEMIRFQRYENGGKLVWSYGSVVIPRRGAPSWVTLGDAQSIEDAVERLVGPFDRRGRGVRPLGKTDGDAVSTLRQLYDDLWEPLTALFPAGTTHVLLSPDAAAAFVPWAALLDEREQFIAERWQVTQVGSGRDLARSGAQPTAKTFLALADGGEDLPFSRREVAAVARAAQQHGWRATTFFGAEATEDELFRRAAPSILHLATHAATLDGDTGSVQNRLRANPMYRAYLLLGGGYDTLDEWERGGTVPFPLDGILTAEEASGLDLSTTWLTVLSACQTGTGDIRAGEGILGLRRGFLLAGTRHLVFSLWRVRDEPTADFMELFYARLFATGNPAASFHETQVTELRRWRASSGIPAALYQAGGFVFM